MCVALSSALINQQCVDAADVENVLKHGARIQSAKLMPHAQMAVVLFDARCIVLILFG